MSRKHAAKKSSPQLPPHPDAEAHERVIKRLGQMTHEQIFQLSVDAGIHNPDGTLTKHYAPSKKRK
ncbi:MAG: hypothetical protein ACO1OB_16630 [Archangium sp.]